MMRTVGRRAPTFSVKNVVIIFCKKYVCSEGREYHGILLKLITYDFEVVWDIKQFVLFLVGVCCSQKAYCRSSILLILNCNSLK